MKIRKTYFLLKTIVIMIGFSSCSTIPKGVVAVKPFDKDKCMKEEGLGEKGKRIGHL